MDNKLLIENYLLILKSTVEVYVHGTIESANNDIRMLLKDNLNEILTSQADTFDIMAENNWYPVCNIDTNKINETLSKLKTS